MAPGEAQERNVVIIGLSGSGKTSLANMLWPGPESPTSNGGEICTHKEESRRCDLGRGQTCILHDTVGLIEGGGWSFQFFPPKISKKEPVQTERLERYLKGLKDTGKLDLVIYHMKAQHKNKRGLQAKHYNKFKSMSRTVVVVTGLERYPNRLETWWEDNAEILGFNRTDQHHACVMTIPKDGCTSDGERRLYDESREVVRALIRRHL